MKKNVIMVTVKCPTCGSTSIRKYGKTSLGKQRYLCKNESCKTKIFILEYSQNARKPGVKEQIIKMAGNASGIRDTSRVLGISTSTVLTTLKKQSQNYQM